MNFLCCCVDIANEEKLCFVAFLSKIYRLRWLISPLFPRGERAVRDLPLNPINRRLELAVIAVREQISPFPLRRFDSPGALIYGEVNRSTYFGSQRFDSATLSLIKGAAAKEATDKFVEIWLFRSLIPVLVVDEFNRGPCMPPCFLEPL